MNLDDGAIHRHRLELDTHDLLALQVFKHTVQHPVLGPAVHPRVDGVPIAKFLRQSSPFAAMFGDIQNGVEHLPVRNAYIASLDREMQRDAFVLRVSEFHPWSTAQTGSLVLTGPSWGRSTDRRPLCDQDFRSLSRLGQPRYHFASLS